MRAFCATLLLTAIAFFAVHTSSRAELFTQTLEPDRYTLKTWEFSHLKYVDLLGITHWYYLGYPGQMDAMMNYLQAEMSERRCIVTRKSDTALPTWDGRTPALIFDPTIWHFDPDSRGASADSTLGISNRGSLSADSIKAQDDLRCRLFCSAPASEWTTPDSSNRLVAIPWRLFRPSRFPTSADLANLPNAYLWEWHRQLIAESRPPPSIDFGDVLDEVRLGFICSVPGTPAREWLNQDPASSDKEIFCSFVPPSEAEIANYAKAWARRRRLIEERQAVAQRSMDNSIWHDQGPERVFEPAIWCFDPAPHSHITTIEWRRHPIDEMPAADGADNEAPARRTLLDFMVENPHFAIKAEQPAYYTSTYLFR